MKCIDIHIIIFVLYKCPKDSLWSLCLFTVVLTLVLKIAALSEIGV